MSCVQAKPKTIALDISPNRCVFDINMKTFERVI